MGFHEVAVGLVLANPVIMAPFSAIIFPLPLVRMPTLAQ
jgi:hypothetical protein